METRLIRIDCYGDTHVILHKNIKAIDNLTLCKGDIIKMGEKIYIVTRSEYNLDVPIRKIYFMEYNIQK